MRRYEPLWKEIKAKRMAVVRCRAEKTQTIIQAVKKEKSRENTLKKALDIPHYGNLSFTKTPLEGGKMQIIFKLGLTSEAFDL